MRLYAKTTSDRATKGQGGNKNIDIELYVHDREIPIGNIELYLNEDTKDGCEVDEWILNWYPYKEDNEDQEPIMIAQGHTRPLTKGKRQKGECLHKNTFNYMGKIHCTECKECLN